VHAKYSAKLVGTKGKPPYHWSIISGQLPKGLVLSPTTGAISGTPTSKGTFAFVIKVADSSKVTEYSIESLSITIT